MTPETEAAERARQIKRRFRAHRIAAKRAGGEPYTVALTIQRTLEVPVALANSVESAIASATLLAHTTEHPEDHYWTLVSADDPQQFHVVAADAWPGKINNPREAPHDDQ